MGKPDFKQGKRKKASRKQWEEITAAKIDKCRVCGTRYDLQRHHLISRSLWGHDDPDNIVPLCPSCHGRVESVGNNATNVMLGRRLTDSEYAYMERMKPGYASKRYYVMREKAA